MGFDKFDYEHRFLPKAIRDKLRREQQEPENVPVMTVAQSLYFSRCRIK